MTHAEIEALMKGIAPAIRQYVERELAPLREQIAASGDGKTRLAALEARIAEVEKGGLEYCGTHQRALPYRRGSCITHNGSLWIALRQVEIGEAGPSENPGAWQLAVKAGRDGKDANGHAR
jgi:hypothetical protein